MSRRDEIAVRRDRFTLLNEGWLCARRQRRGWYCARGLHLDGPCALVPYWWNLPARRRWTR